MNTHYNYFNNYRINDKNYYDQFLGVTYGNISKKEYIDYKHNSVPTLTYNKENELRSILFAINDLTLILDVNPNNEEALKGLYKVISMYNEKSKDFNNTNYPLLIVNQNNQNNYQWENNWPFGGNV